MCAVGYLPFVETAPRVNVDLRQGDCIEVMKTIAPGSINCCVTSPPYFGLRDYGVDGQIGLEGTPDAFVAKMVDVFREVRRVLRDDGTCFLNLGDSYFGSSMTGGNNGFNASGGDEGFKIKRQFKKPSTSEASRNATATSLKPKDLIGIPWRVAFALQADGWYLRSDIIWHKPNPMPESVKDRPTKSHEYIFMLTKSAAYHYDADAIAEPSEGKVLARAERERAAGKAYSRGIGHDGRHDSGVSMTHATKPYRNKRSVWTVATRPFKSAHFATFPPKLIEPCILAGCPVGGTVLDPFSGAGTTGLVSVQHGRNYLGIELNPSYLEMSRQRIESAQLKGSLNVGA